MSEWSQSTLQQIMNLNKNFYFVEFESEFIKSAIVSMTFFQFLRIWYWFFFITILIKNRQFLLCNYDYN